MIVGIPVFWLHVVLLLGVIYFGARYGGIALGILGGFGVAVLAFIFQVMPGKPPIDVMLIILAVVTTSATLEATGALDLIVRIVERILRKHPDRIVFLAPLSTFVLTILVGTGHAVYPLLPVIYDVAYSKGIRPERPMAVASVASQMGIVASPISAALAAIIGITAQNGVPVTLWQVMVVTIPSGLVGVLLAAAWSLNRGKNLSDDVAFQEKMRSPEIRAYIEGGACSVLDQAIPKAARTSLALFILGIVLVIVVAVHAETLLPSIQKNGVMVKISMATAIQFIIFAVGALILFSTRVKSQAIMDAKVFNAGMAAVVMIFGIVWMSDTIVTNNNEYIRQLISSAVSQYSWLFAVAMAIASIFLQSQAATLGIMLNLGFALGLPISTLVGAVPACYAYFFFCIYPSDLATINFDRTGTTRAGRWILNHSFMAPGLIGVGSATIVGMLIARILFNG